MKRFMAAVAFCAAALIGAGTGLGTADLSVSGATGDAYSSIASSSETTEPYVEPEKYTSGCFVYQIVNDNVQICGYTGDVPEDLTIPSELGGWRVAKICKEAFYKCTTLHTVVVPDCVTEIGEAAFAFTTLEKITILNDNCEIYDDASTFTSGFAGGQTDAKYGNYFSGRICGYSGSKALQYAWKYGYTSQEMYEPTWTLNAAGTLTISGYGPMRDYGPGHMSEHAPWYDYREDVRAIVISQGITTIGENAFEECRNAVSLTIPEGVTAIPLTSFQYCDSLTYIDIPESVTEFGDSFWGTPWLEAKKRENPLVIVNNHILSAEGCSGDVVIPYGVTTIPGGAFEYCDQLTSVTIPDSVTMIGYAAFAYCTSLKQIEIPDGVTEIGVMAFYRCKSLASVKLPAGLKILGDGDAPMDSGEGMRGAFSECPLLTKIELPEGLEQIGHFAFAGTGLTEVTVPESVKQMSDMSFCACGNLKTVTILNPDCAFYKWWLNQGKFSENTVICGYDDSTAQAFAAEYGYSFRSLGEAPGHPEITLASGTCGENLTWRLDGAGTLTISGTGAMTDFIAPDMPWRDYTKKIRTILVEDGVTSIGNNAFENTYVTSVSLPDSLTSIGDYAFESCERLTAVSLPDSVTTLGVRAFDYCMALTSVRLSAGLKEFPDGYEPGDIYYGCGVFSRCDSLKKIILPEGLERIGTYTFFLSGLTEVTIPASVKRIEFGAFGNCRGMQKVTILNPDCVIKGGKYTFVNDGSSMDADPYDYSGVIVGYAGSTAEAFAKAQGYRFEVYNAPPAIAAFDTGDVDGSASINASDAAQVLIAAAAIGAGRDADLTAAQKKAADVNSDTAINATDAAIVLQYAAAVGAGQKNVTIQDFVH